MTINVLADIITICVVAALVFLNAFLMERSQDKIKADREYCRKANADFAETAVLMRYGAVEEAIAMLELYEREEAERKKRAARG